MRVLPRSLNPSGLRFGAWTNSEAPETFRLQVERLERTLETPIPAVQEPLMDEYLPRYRQDIQEVKDMLAQVTENNGFGMKDAIHTLRIMRDTGYQLTESEQTKLKILIRKSDYGLFDHITYFPQSGQYDYASARQTQEDLNLLLSAWIKEPHDYRSLVRLVNVIDRSERFIASSEVETAIGEALQKLQTTFEAPDVRKAFLEKNGHSFRSLSQVAGDIRTVLQSLVLDASPEDVEQVIDLIAQRHRKIKFAGITPEGEIYIITESIDRQNGKTSVHFGKPGEIRELRITGGSGAMDGSDTRITTSSINFQFTRNSCLSGRVDHSRWRALVNGVPAREFPTDELDTGKAR